MSWIKKEMKFSAFCWLCPAWVSQALSGRQMYLVRRWPRGENTRRILCLPWEGLEVLIDEKNTSAWEILHIFHIKNHLSFRYVLGENSFTSYFCLVNAWTSWQFWRSCPLKGSKRGSICFSSLLGSCTPQSPVDCTASEYHSGTLPPLTLKWLIMVFLKLQLSWLS